MQHSGLPDLDCACATIRRAARLVTQIYDGELRAKLQAPQFALLKAMEHMPGVQQSVLARALAIDKTTLSRNLALMVKKGWIQQERGLSLTAAGRALLSSAKPNWRRAQKRLRSAMKDEQWDAMWQAMRDVTNAAHELQKRKGAN